MEYLTKKVNGIFELISVFVEFNEGVENEKTHQNVDGSFLVAGTGLEPMSAVADRSPSVLKILNKILNKFSPNSGF